MACASPDSQLRRAQRPIRNPPYPGREKGTTQPPNRPTRRRAVASFTNSPVAPRPSSVVSSSISPSHAFSKPRFAFRNTSPRPLKRIGAPRSKPPRMRLRTAARVILVGAPGVGKGTQSERLLQKFPQLSSISSGDLLRYNIRQRTPLGTCLRRHVHTTTVFLRGNKTSKKIDTNKGYHK